MTAARFNSCFNFSLDWLGHTTIRVDPQRHILKATKARKFHAIYKPKLVVFVLFELIFLV